MTGADKFEQAKAVEAFARANGFPDAAVVLVAHPEYSGDDLQHGETLEEILECWDEGDEVMVTFHMDLQASATAIAQSWEPHGEERRIAPHWKGVQKVTSCEGCIGTDWDCRHQCGGCVEWSRYERKEAGA